MPEGTNPTPNTPATPAASTTGSQQEAPKAYEAPATQADLDRIVENRLARECAKYADYDDLKTRAQKWDEAEAANKSELQKAQDAAAAAEKRAADAEAKVLRAEVAAAKGVPADLLSGANRAELEASADKLLEFKGQTPKAPPPPGDGASVHETGETSAADTVKAALGR